MEEITIIIVSGLSQLTGAWVPLTITYVSFRISVKLVKYSKGVEIKDKAVLITRKGESVTAKNKANQEHWLCYYVVRTLKETTI